MSDQIASRFEIGDHGGTYCGNPLGCAVAYAVITYLLDNDISVNVAQMGALALNRMQGWVGEYPEMIAGVRGRGLLLAAEFMDEGTASLITEKCLARRLFVRQTQGTMIRVFPALNIRPEEMDEGLSIMEAAIGGVAKGLG